MFVGSSIAGAEPSRTPVKVDTAGVTARILYEAPIEGTLTDLNGRYKLRVTSMTIAPGGHVGSHNHLGPGIRQMTSGEMDYILPDRTVVQGKAISSSRRAT